MIDWLCALYVVAMGVLLVVDVAFLRADYLDDFDPPWHLALPKLVMGLLLVGAGVRLMGRLME